jgi:hypothetical protein
MGMESKEPASLLAQQAHLDPLDKTSCTLLCAQTAFGNVHTKAAADFLFCQQQQYGLLLKLVSPFLQVFNTGRSLGATTHSSASCC